MTDEQRKADLNTLTSRCRELYGEDFAARERQLSHLLACARFVEEHGAHVDNMLDSGNCSACRLAREALSALSRSPREGTK